jgi:4-hydroxybenzoate polyprenyltransferase
MPWHLLRLARPKDWIKNVFVLMPVPFCVAAGGQLHWPQLICGLLGFCLINSAVYTLNDLFDAAADRLHPQKCRRPIAAGEVSQSAALVQFVVLVLAGSALVWYGGRLPGMAIVAVYVAVNAVYSLGAKREPLLDTFLLSSGFVLRVLLGCVLVHSSPSGWLLLCSSSLSLFLGFGKRRADLLTEVDPVYRPSLQGYTHNFLDQSLAICATVAILSYALYCIEGRLFIGERQLASMPFVAYGILNYLRLMYLENAGGSPVDIALSSRASQVCAVGWALAVAWGLGWW